MLSKEMEYLKNGNSGVLPSNSSLGGYGLIYIDDSDKVYCGACANSLASDDTVTINNAYIHWEGASTCCENCNCELESEYGDNEEQKDLQEEINQILELDL